MIGLRSLAHLTSRACLASPVFALSRLSTRRHFCAAPTSADLQKLGIKRSGRVFYNLSYEQLYEHEKRNGEVQDTTLGAINVDTGKFTGRSPNDRYIVRDETTEKTVDWGSVNKGCSPQVFDELYDLAAKNMSGKDLYVFDGFCGASASSRKKIRFVTEKAWHSHFVTNMFIRPSAAELKNFKPDFTLINSASTINPKYKEQGLHSDVYVAFNIKKNLAVIGGTLYGGEMKKGIFAMMNYWLPMQGHLPMHCSANKGKNGDTALFFGLSGTGKTTLSADPDRYLIGDDEHGWDNNGIFNFEGGCYAKCINLSKEKEPMIYSAIRRDTVLENLTVSQNGVIDFTDKSKTENTRAAYPLHFIDNFEPTSQGGHPKNIIFLTADAFGVLPPVAKLTPQQAMYHFISGYTAKVAGTERGIKEPVPTFSACFGAAFLPLHPTVYAKLLEKKMQQYQANAYLVNTGWTGGSFPKGKRFDLPVTRACIDAILSGEIEKSEFVLDPLWNIYLPKSVPGVEPRLLNPTKAWADQRQFKQVSLKLANMFVQNYKQYQKPGQPDFAAFGPRV